AHHQHLAHPGAGLDPGARAGRHHHDPAAAVPADDAVGDGVALEGKLFLPVQLPGGVLGGLLHGGRHLVGLAIAAGHPALAVADDDHGVEAEPATALDDGRAPPDLDDAILELVL